MKLDRIQPAVQRPWPRLLSRELAADYVGLGVSTLDAGVPGFPAPIQVGRRRLYDIRDLDRWADALAGQPLDAVAEQSHKRDLERGFLEGRAKRKGSHP